ncbi:PucR family transcriptional regulator [Solicola gregarius]|uniref:Helix-turn-helix domain-containing protein n=1 Tax=Solicola gregarius TaxID=2908642 RepID=A0AA46TKB5_9ACTN|nr:helix-turn-helix domain-containing protein [Solicola gregarius]UYM06892.1 helix-turn-helix domain-containing protein [Solicola gregarius]
MTTRPRASLGRVLEDLGTTLLELVCGDPDRAGHIGGVVIHDPLDESVSPRNAIVLGVGVREPAAIADLLDSLSEHGAAGLVVRAPVEADATIASAVERSGVALLAVTRGASWAQLAAMLRSLIAEGDVGETGPETLGGMPSGDLFALANAIATLLDAPVTIEDRSSRVLAFSGRQDEADSSRVETILGRQVPARFSRILEERGVFQQLYRSHEPIQVEPMPGPDPEFALPRVALAIRAGDEILGSIWAAVRTPLSPERTQALQDAVKLVALHMLRLRAGADVERRLRADLVATVLEAGPGAAEALSRLGLADQDCVVLALAPVEPADDAEPNATRAQLVAEEQRMADAFSMHLGAVYPRSAVALVGDVAYGIVGVRRDQPDAEERAVLVATEFLERIGSGDRLLVGVGVVADDDATLVRSRIGADRALRVLRLGRTSAQVARIEDVHIEALMLELADLSAARGDRASGPVSRLIAYDAKRRTCLVDTLRAWLDAFGDVVAASAAVYTHPNTFRYRLRRLAEVGEIDLSDPDQRFAAMVELRLIGRAMPEAGGA